MHSASAIAAVAAAKAAAAASFASSAAAASSSTAAAKAAESKRRHEDGANGLNAKKAATLSSVFGLKALAIDDADEAERVADRGAGAESTGADVPASRRSAAKTLLTEGEACAEHGELESALACCDRGLRLLGVGPKCGGVAAVSASEVAAAAHAGPGGTLRPERVPFADDDAEATRGLIAQLHEAKAQILLMSPEDARHAGHCFGNPVRRAQMAAEAAVGSAPRWAPGWLTLGRVLLACGEPERARTALSKAKQLDKTFFASEDGAADLSAATQLVVKSALVEAAAEVAEKSMAHEGNGPIAGSDVDTDPAKHKSWRFMPFNKEHGINS